MSKSPLSPEVAQILRCPKTQQPLREATPDEMALFPGDFPEGAYITEDGEHLYPIEDGFPILVGSSAKQLNS
tara:strand:+ start:2041 stop:2256 length:216 start_codon:yes stop_codon:yes gene_type:complete